MTIKGLSADQFEQALSACVTPSTPIDSFEHLVDRTAQLERIEEALASPGRHVFIYGVKGSGKTSLAQTAAYKHESSYSSPVLCACGRQTSFSSIVRDAVEHRPPGLVTPRHIDTSKACSCLRRHSASTEEMR